MTFGFLTPKLQLNTVIPVDVGRFQDSLKLGLLVSHIQTFKIRQERLNRSGQPLEQAKSVFEEEGGGYEPTMVHEAGPPWAATA